MKKLKELIFSAVIVVFIVLGLYVLATHLILLLVLLFCTMIFLVYFYLFTIGK